MNHKLLFRLIAPAVIIGAFLLIGCVAGIWYVHELQDDLASVISQDMRSLQAAQELEIRVRQLRFHTLQYLIDPSDERLGLINADEDRFETALSVARERAVGPEEEACVKQIDENYKLYQQEQSELRARAGKVESVKELGEILDAHPLRKVVDPCQELLALNRKRVNEINRESRRVTDQASLVLFVLGVVGPCSGLLMGYSIARGLSKSIYRLSVRVQDMAQHLEQNLGSIQLVVDGDIANLDRQLQHIVGRVEEVALRLQEQQRALIRAEQLSAVGRLAASVAHEVRNPLTGVRLLVDSALASNNDKPLNLTDLGVIQREVTRVEQTVQGFLNLARLPELERRTWDLTKVIRQAVTLVAVRARQQGVEVSVTVPPEPVPACIDRSQFDTVLVNLFINALDAMPGGGRLTVSLDRLPGDDIRFTVEDTGEGIPPEVLNRLFTPFVTTKATGTGLGLSICARVLETHGATIRGANRPGGGAAFTITLPASAGRVAEPAGRAADSAGGP